MTTSQSALKREAGEYAVRFVESGMVVGLGHGSTTIFAIRKLASLLASGELHDIVGVPCSLRVKEEARALSIPLITPDKVPPIDVTIDGADEVDPACNVIKGGGGALLREKIVAQATRREIIVVDETKLSEQLGVQWAVPVEVVTFGWRAQARFLASLGAEVTVRSLGDGSHYRTELGNLILDCAFGPLDDPWALDATLNQRAGIVAHGLFLGLVSDVLVAHPGGIEHRQCEKGRAERV